MALLSREWIVAKPGYNRWLVPPAALAIHLSIGMAYGFSVFWLPLSKAIGITQPVPCPARPPVEGGFLTQLLEALKAFGHLLVQTDCDWKISTLGWMFTLFFVFLGSSAALFGAWVERGGPRKAGWGWATSHPCLP